MTRANRHSIAVHRTSDSRTGTINIALIDGVRCGGVASGVGNCGREKVVRALVIGEIILATLALSARRTSTQGWARLQSHVATAAAHSSGARSSELTTFRLCALGSPTRSTRVDENVSAGDSCAIAACALVPWVTAVTDGAVLSRAWHTISIPGNVSVFVTSFGDVADAPLRTTFENGALRTLAPCWKISNSLVYVCVRRASHPNILP